MQEGGPGGHLKILKLEIAERLEGPVEGVEWGMKGEVGGKFREVGKGKHVGPWWPYNGILF